MGKYGRVINKDGFKVELNNYGEGSVVPFIDEYIKYLNEELSKSISEDDTDLLNIRDEMVGLLNKLKYLLSLK